MTSAPMLRHAVAAAALALLSVAAQAQSSNQAPVLTAPSSLSTNQDTALPIAGLSVADDSASLDTVVTIPANTGTLAAAASSASITGNNTASLTLSGSPADISTALAGLQYTPAAGYNTGTPDTPFNLSVTSTDSGATGLPLNLPPLNGNVGFRVVPAGWTYATSRLNSDNPNDIGNSPNIISGNGPHPEIPGYAISHIEGTSRDGGTMVYLEANPTGGQENIETTLSGLVAGQTYSFSLQWQQAQAVNPDYPPITSVYGGRLRVIVDGSPHDFTSSGGLDDSWQDAVVSFVASGSTAKVVLTITPPDPATVTPDSNGNGIAIDGGTFAAEPLSATANIAISVVPKAEPPQPSRAATPVPLGGAGFAALLGLLLTGFAAWGRSRRNH